MAVHSFVTKAGSGKKEKQAMYDMLGPGLVDQFVRQAIQNLWMIIPPSPRRLDEVERQFRRIADRALRDLREDAAAFGKLL